MLYMLCALFNCTKKLSEIESSRMLIDLQCFRCEICVMLCLELAECYVVRM